MINQTDMDKLIHSIIAIHNDKGTTIKLLGILGHSSINGNEKPNPYAKTATSSNTS